MHLQHFCFCSFSKILFVSFTLFYTFHVHVIFAALAGCVLALFVIFPIVLLILYPTRLFRRFHAVDFAGGMLCTCLWNLKYGIKDGTNGTRDFRMVSVSFLVLRILTVASFINRYHSHLSPSAMQCALFVSATCLYVVLRPYKSNSKNNADFFILVLLALTSLTFLVVLCDPCAIHPGTSFHLSIHPRVCGCQDN